MYVLTDILKDVVNKGTARIARNKGIKMALAAKTGTSNDGKDSWLAGFSPNILAVSWVGYDSSKPINLTGASGAGRIWSNFMLCVEPMQEDLDFIAPPGVAIRKLEKKSGLLDDGYCNPEDVIEEVFIAGTEPKLLANCSNTSSPTEYEENMPSAYQIIGNIIKRIWGRK